MKRITTSTLIICLLTCLNIQAQDKLAETKEKTNEIGLYVAPGTHFLTANDIFTSQNNFYFAFGGFYQRPLSTHFKWRIGVAGMYQLATNKLKSGSSKVSYRTLYLEIPLLFQYIVNPDNNFKFYTGIGVTPRRSFYTKSTTTIDDVKSTTVFRNNRIDMEVVPSVFIGLNAALKEHLSFYFQPAYSPSFINISGNNWVHYLSAEVGLIYKL